MNEIHNNLLSYCRQQGCEELLLQWNVKRNGDLKPGEISYGSNQRVWWICSSGHEWQATIGSRTIKKCKCPVCSGKKVVAGENDLGTTNPELAAQWHPARNKGLTPQDVSSGSGKKVWWVCSGGHEWQATIANRTVRKSGCPACAYKMKTKGIRGVNDLAGTNPEIAAQWHPVLNEDLTPQSVSFGSSKRVWWRCEKGHEWQATINSRTNCRTNCPVCSGKKVVAGENDLSTTNPALARQWHPVRNGNLTPRDVSSGSGKKVWWICSRGHEWQATINSRTSYKTSCTVCRKREKG